MTKDNFKLLCENTVLLDGATGSNLIAAGMPRGTCTEEWVLEHKEVLIDLQRRYLEAGSQIVIAPTFGANRDFLAGQGLASQMERMNKDLVALSKEAVGDRALVAGDVTCVSRVIGSGPKATYERALELYGEQIRYLAQGGADLILMETMISVDDTMAALEAAQAECDLPILCSLTTEADGSVYSGGNIFDAVETLQEMGADAVGINCSVGPDQLESIVEGMRRRVTLPIIVKPNAGMPFITDDGRAVYNMTPEEFGRHMKKLMDLGANIVGGCCGTSPDYIREIKKYL